MSARRLARRFRRHADALAELFEFSAASVQRLGADAGLVRTLDLVLEELFTNMIKYSASELEVRVEMRSIRGGVEVTMDDVGVDRYDITAARPVDIEQPLERRQPGGLGLHLVRALVDSIEYRYLPRLRTGRITFRKTV